MISAALFLLSLQADKEAVLYGRVGTWMVFDLHGRCSVTSEFESDISLSAIYDFPRDRVTVFIASPRWTSIENDRQYQVRTEFSNGRSYGPATATGAVLPTGKRHSIMLSFDAGDFLDDFAGAQGVEFSRDGELIGGFSLADSRAAATKLRRCSVESYRRNPHDPFASAPPAAAGSGTASAFQRSITRRYEQPGSGASQGSEPPAALAAVRRRPGAPVEEGAPVQLPHPFEPLEVGEGSGPAGQPIVAAPAPTPARLISGGLSNDDYPAVARRAGAEGTTRVTLTVNQDGRVSGCTVTGSSGNSALDSTTCSLMLRRYRFTPATRDGKPIASTYSTSARWSLPSD
jgi:TonB family protein